MGLFILMKKVSDVVTRDSGTSGCPTLKLFPRQFCPQYVIIVLIGITLYLASSSSWTQYVIIFSQSIIIHFRLTMPLKQSLK